MQAREPIVEASKWFNLRVADGLRRAMQATGAKQADVAELLGVKPKQVSYKLNAHSGFSIEDLVALAIRFGVQVIPQPASRDDLFPPQMRPRLSWDDSAAGAEVAMRRSTVLTDLDHHEFVTRLAGRLTGDTSMPRRLLIDADLRRYAIGVLDDLGFSHASLFGSETEGVALWIGPAKDGAMSFIVSPTSLRLEDEAATEYARIVRASTTLACAPAVAKLLIAVVGPELEAVLDEAISATPSSVLELPSPAGVVRARVLATERAGDDTVVSFDIELDSLKSTRSDHVAS